MQKIKTQFRDSSGNPVTSGYTFTVRSVEKGVGSTAYPLVQLGTSGFYESSVALPAGVYDVLKDGVSVGKFTHDAGVTDVGDSDSSLLMVVVRSVIYASSYLPSGVTPTASSMYAAINAAIGEAQDGAEIIIGEYSYPSGDLTSIEHSKNWTVSGTIAVAKNLTINLAGAKLTSNSGPVFNTAYRVAIKDGELVASAASAVSNSGSDLVLCDNVKFSTAASIASVSGPARFCGCTGVVLSDKAGVLTGMVQWDSGTATFPTAPQGIVNSGSTARDWGFAKIAPVHLEKFFKENLDSSFTGPSAVAFDTTTPNSPELGNFGTVVGRDLYTMRKFWGPVKTAAENAVAYTTPHAIAIDGIKMYRGSSLGWVSATAAASGGVYPCSAARSVCTYTGNPDKWKLHVSLAASDDTKIIGQWVSVDNTKTTWMQAIDLNEMIGVPALYKSVISSTPRYFTSIVRLQDPYSGSFGRCWSLGGAIKDGVVYIFQNYEMQNSYGLNAFESCNFTIEVE